VSRSALATRGALAVAVLLLALDFARPPAVQWSVRAELSAIAAYQRTLSPTFERLGVACRFRPSCSRYAEGAIRAHGGLVGPARALWRVVRCGPWTPEGTLDPP
jgi:uncharacterized protein